MHIQIILYNSDRFIEKLILGLNLLNNKSKIIVHFWDNSNQNLQEKILSLSPNFAFTYDISETNLGFGIAHNKIFEKYKKDYDKYFIVANHDSLPFDDAITNLNEFISDYGENTGAVELTQFPSEHPKEYDQLTFETEWVSGAFTCFSKDIYNEINGFDENIFMYCEDVDISWRILQIGKKILHCPYSKICHITQSFDLQKNSDFEQIHSLAGNAYLRFKYISDDFAHNYLQLLKHLSNYNQIEKVYLSSATKLTTDELLNFRKFTSPAFYTDTNYARHRW